MNSNAERIAFADKLIGKTVAEQTAAGNAEGWISSVMFKAVKTTEDLHNIVAFSASIATAEMDTDLQAMYKRMSLTHGAQKNLIVQPMVAKMAVVEGCM